MIKVAYISLFIGIILNLILFIKDFKISYIKKKNKDITFIKFISEVNLKFVDILVLGGCGLYGIEKFLK